MPSGAPGVAIRQIPTLPTQFSDLTPSQLQAVQALATGATVTAAAEAAGVHRDTIYEWRRALPAFAQAVEDAKAAYETHLHDQLAGLAQLAMAAIRRLLEDPATPPAIQLRAALAVLRRSHFEHRDWNIPAPAEKLADPSAAPPSISFKALPTISARTPAKPSREAAPAPAAPAANTSAAAAKTHRPFSSAQPPPDLFHARYPPGCAWLSWQNTCSSE